MLRCVHAALPSPAPVLIDGFTVSTVADSGSIAGACGDVDAVEKALQFMVAEQ